MLKADNETYLTLKEIQSISNISIEELLLLPLPRYLYFKGFTSVILDEDSLFPYTDKNNNELTGFDFDANCFTSFPVYLEGFFEVSTHYSDTKVSETADFEFSETPDKLSVKYLELTPIKSSIIKIKAKYSPKDNKLFFNGSLDNFIKNTKTKPYEMVSEDEHIEYQNNFNEALELGEPLFAHSLQHNMFGNKIIDNDMLQTIIEKDLFNSYDEDSKIIEYYYPAEKVKQVLKHYEIKFNYKEFNPTSLENNKSLHNQSKQNKLSKPTLINHGAIVYALIQNNDKYLNKNGQINRQAVIKEVQNYFESTDYTKGSHALDRALSVLIDEIENASGIAQEKAKQRLSQTNKSEHS